jgi:hypothetical protein
MVDPTIKRVFIDPIVPAPRRLVRMGGLGLFGVLFTAAVWGRYLAPDGITEKIRRELVDVPAHKPAAAAHHGHGHH